MNTRVPSPALVISVIAFVVACSATAYAATRITKSSQIKNGIVTGRDIKNRSIKSVDIKNGSVKGADIAKDTIKLSNLSNGALRAIAKAAGSGGGGGAASEVSRASGPDNQPPGVSKVLEMTVPPGSYVISAKVVQQAFPKTGLLSASVPIALGHCKLTGAAGVDDDSFVPVAVNNRASPTAHKLQTVATITANSVIRVNCDANAFTQDVPWSASNSSIIALKVGSVRKTAG